MNRAMAKSESRKRGSGWTIQQSQNISDP
jgi:hypothetical protein